jgi:hypothetical protein
VNVNRFERLHGTGTVTKKYHDGSELRLSRHGSSRTFRTGTLRTSAQSETLTLHYITTTEKGFHSYNSCSITAGLTIVCTPPFHYFAPEYLRKCCDEQHENSAILTAYALMNSLALHIL